MEIDQKLIKKANRIRKNIKNDKNAASGTAFSARNRFLVDFWPPEGTPKWLKIYGGFPVKGSWGASGMHFGRLGVFFSILTQFWVDFGLISHHFLIIWGQIWGFRRDKGEKGRKGESDTARQQPTT